MTVQPDSRLRHDYQGDTYLFCSEKCLVKFRVVPASYTNAEAAPVAPVPAGALMPMITTKIMATGSRKREMRCMKKAIPMRRERRCTRISATNKMSAD